MKFFVTMFIFLVSWLFIAFSARSPFTAGSYKVAIANEINESNSFNRIAEQSNSQNSEAALEVKEGRDENKVNAAELNSVDTNCPQKDLRAEDNVKETPPEEDPNSLED